MGRCGGRKGGREREREGGWRGREGRKGEREGGREGRRRRVSFFFLFLVRRVFLNLNFKRKSMITITT